MARAPRVDPAVPEIVDRLHRMQRDIVRSAEWARSADEAFRALNDLGEARHRVAASSAGSVARLIEQAILDLQLINTVKLFDRPGLKDGPLHTDRVSLVVGRQLMDHPGVMDHLRADARTWPRGDPEANVVELDRRFRDFCTRLDRLLGEEPNRLAIMRDLRDDSIAHNLRLEEVPQRPQYAQIWQIAAELTHLVDDFSYVADGVTIFWQWGRMSWSSRRMWTAVADHCLDEEGDLAAG